MSDTIDVLAIGPHPDDVELFIGGSVRHLVALGYRVVVLDLTRGESASRGTPAGRQIEAAAAAEVLGVTREQLGLPDGGLVAGDKAQVDALVGYLRRRRPELVMCPWHEERHPDHEAAAALVLRATFLASAGGYHPKFGEAEFGEAEFGEAEIGAAEGGEVQLPRHVVREVLHYPMRVGARPSFVIDISHVRDVKQRAIACHQSQLGPAPDGTQTLVSRSVAAIEARDAFYGAHIGAAAGEPFVTRATLHLSDPISHFRTRPGPAFFFEGR